MLKGKVKALTTKNKDAEDSAEALNTEIKSLKAKIAALESDLAAARKVSMKKCAIFF